MSINDPIQLADSKEERLLGRKLLASIVYVISLTIFAGLMTKIASPENVVVQGMWMITSIYAFVIGGQALIDTIVPVAMRWADAYAAAKKPGV